MAMAAAGTRGELVAVGASGLAIDLRVRTLVLHQADGFSERGLALSLSYNPTPSTPLGLTARSRGPRCAGEGGWRGLSPCLSSPSAWAQRPPTARRGGGAGASDHHSGGPPRP